MDGVWQTIGLVLGGGAIGSIVTGFLNYLLARSKQPVDDYAKLVTIMQAMIDQERKHSEITVGRLQSDHDKCVDQHLAAVKEIGMLQGRLEEQREMVDRLIRIGSETKVEVAQLKDRVTAVSNGNTEAKKGG